MITISARYDMEVQDVKTENLDNLAKLILNVIMQYRNCKREHTYFNEKSSLLLVCNNTYGRRVDIVTEKLELINKAKEKLTEYENFIELKIADLFEFIIGKGTSHLNVREINMISADNNSLTMIKNSICKLFPAEIEQLCTIINDINFNIDKLNELRLELDFDHNEMINKLKSK
jgi:hypothetical protein